MFFLIVLYVFIMLLVTVVIFFIENDGNKKLLLLPAFFAVVALITGFIGFNNREFYEERYNNYMEEYSDYDFEGHKNRMRFGSSEMAEAYSDRMEETIKEGKKYKNDLVKNTATFIVAFITSGYCFIIIIVAPFVWKKNE